MNTELSSRGRQLTRKHLVHLRALPLAPSPPLFPTSKLRLGPNPSCLLTVLRSPERDNAVTQMISGDLKEFLNI